MHVLDDFRGSTVYSLLPSPVTWKFFAWPREKGSRLLTEHQCDVNEDTQHDRLGLPCEREYITNAVHGRRSLTTFLRSLDACPVCKKQGVRADRWHMKFECCGTDGKLAELRKRIAIWLAANSQRLNSTQVSAVLQAIASPSSLPNDTASLLPIKPPSARGLVSYLSSSSPMNCALQRHWLATIRAACS